MADYKIVTIKNGKPTNLATGDAAIAPELKSVGDTDVGGALDVTGAGAVGGALTVTGTGDFNGILSANSTQAATNTTSGALQVAGGAGIVGALYVGGLVDISGALSIGGNVEITGTLDVTGDTSVSTFDSSGATSLATGGGNVAIAGGGGTVTIATSGVTTTIQGDLNVDEAVTLDTTLDVTGDTSVSTFDSSGATSLATGSGNVAIAGGGGTVTIATSGVTTTIQGDLNVDEAVTLDTTLDVTGDTSVSTFDSSGATSATGSGNVAIAGGGGTVTIATSGVTTTIQGDLNVDEAVTLDSTLDVTGDTSVSTFDSSGVTQLATGGAAVTINAAGSATTVAGTLTVTEDANFDSTTGSTSSTTGAVVIDGGAGIAENLYVGGNLNIAGTTTQTGQASFGGDVDVTGDLTVGGDIVSRGAVDIVVQDQFLELGNGNVSTGAVAGGYAQVNSKSGGVTFHAASFDEASRTITLTADGGDATSTHDSGSIEITTLFASSGGDNPQIEIEDKDGNPVAFVFPTNFSGSTIAEQTNSLATAINGNAAFAATSDGVDTVIVQLADENTQASSAITVSTHGGSSGAANTVNLSSTPPAGAMTNAIIMVSGLTTAGENNGLYAVSGTGAGTIVIANTVTAPIQFCQTAIQDATEAATVVFVKLYVQAASDGNLTDSNGDAIASGTLADSFQEFASLANFTNGYSIVGASSTSLQVAYDNGSQINNTNTGTPFQVAGDGTITLSTNANGPVSNQVRRTRPVRLVLLVLEQVLVE